MTFTATDAEIIKRNSQREYSYGLSLLIQAQERLEDINAFCKTESAKECLNQAQKAIALLSTEYRAEQNEKAYINSRLDW